jgi:hypothetical protein
MAWEPYLINQRPDLLALGITFDLPVEVPACRKLDECIGGDNRPIALNDWEGRAGAVFSFSWNFFRRRGSSAGLDLGGSQPARSPLS